MAQPRLVEANKTQRTIEQILCMAAWVLAVFHMLLAEFRYTVDYTAFRPYERWYALILVIVAVGYILFTKIRYPRTMYRVKNLFKRMISYEQIFMSVLFFWFVLVCMVRQPIDGYRWLKAHDWWIMDFGVSAFILFPMAKFLGKDKAKKWIELALHIVVFTYTLFTIYCLWNVFHLHVFTLPSGKQVGMTKTPELMFGCHYNLTGAIAATLFAVCLYMIASQKAVIKVLYGIAGAAHLVVLLLTNSRTVFLSVLVLIAGIVFLTVWEKLAGKKTIIRLAAAAGAALLFGALFWMLRTWMFVWFDKITNFKALSGGAQTASGAAAAAATESGTASAADDVRELNNLSGRTNIWKAALKVMFSSPAAFFFGVTPHGVTEALKQIGGLTFDCAHAHNVFLQTGAAFGVPAMAAFTVFVLRVLWKGLKIELKTDNLPFRGAYAVPVIVLFFVVMNLAEAYLVGYYSIMAAVFYLMCGWVVDNE